MNETVAASEGLTSLPAIQDMAETYRLSAKAFAFTFRAVAMPQPHTEAEFVSCCLVAREHGLNPLTKEIYFMRDKHGNIQAIVGIDGWIKKCNEHPQFDGLEFEHAQDEKGAPLSVKARIYRKDRSRATEVTEYLKECLQVRKTDGPWQSHPNRMLRHRAMAQCARLAFGFAGIMDRDEFDQWHGAGKIDAGPRDITPAKPPTLDVPDLTAAPPPTMPSVLPAIDALDVPDMVPDFDAKSFLADLAEQRRYCQSEADVAELRTACADSIERLMADDRAKAERILEVE